MSSHENKEKDSSKLDNGDAATFTFYYYNLKNRGNFLELMFAYKDQSYTHVSDMSQLRKIFGAWDGLDSNDEKKSKDEYHSVPFAPPGIAYRDTNSGSKNSNILSQMTVVVPFVADKLDLLPNKVGSIEEYQARKILCDCNDIINEIYTLADGNFRRGTWTLDNIKVYFDGRFEKWLNSLEYPLVVNSGNINDKNNKDECVYYFGNKLCYIDLAVFNMMDGFYELFQEKLFNQIFDKHEYLFKLYKNVSQIKQIKQLIDKQNKDGCRWFSKRSQINERIYPKLKEAYNL